MNAGVTAGRRTQAHGVDSLLARLPAKPPRFDDPQAIAVSYEMLIDDGAEVSPRGRGGHEIRHLGITASVPGSGYLGATVLWINNANAFIARVDRRAA